MSLENLLTLSEERTFNKQEVTEERLMAIMPEMRSLIAFWREYPDYFVDFMVSLDEKKKFKLYTYQRIFMRIAMRHKNVYAVFPRGYSKSFLTVLIDMIRCILFPGIRASVSSGGKEQASSITVQKVEEICKLIPAFDNEINRDRGKTHNSKDNVEYLFKNGSKLDILPATERSRGQRTNTLTLEECVLIDPDKLNEILIPTTVINRNLADGSTDPDEVVNQSQIYITTAGYKNSAAYEKLIEYLVKSLLDPDDYMIMGGTYQTPITEGLQPKDFITQLKISGTYNADSFEREYMSMWTGDIDGAFFSSEALEKNRSLLQPEHEYSGRTTKDGYYVLGVDVGRFDCTTEVCVFKATPQPQGNHIKSLVNIYTYEAEDFEQQSINIKKLYYRYKAKCIAIDANGVGAGLIDFMTKTQIDPETGEDLIPFGVMNDEEGRYKAVKSTFHEPEALFLIKANAPINTEIYSYIKTQMYSGKIRLLQDPQSAKIKLQSTKVGMAMSPEERNEYLLPFELTERLKEQILNLVEENEGVNIILKQSNRGIKKDKFSAFGYGLYYIKQEEENRRKRKRRNISEMLFFS